MEDWRHRAACRGSDPELWYPGRGSNATEAKAVCARCEVRAECLAEGDEEWFGVWGGMTRRERRLARRAGRGATMTP